VIPSGRVDVLHRTVDKHGVSSLPSPLLHAAPTLNRQETARRGGGGKRVGMWRDHGLIEKSVTLHFGWNKYITKYPYSGT
jgi:hypothetical protein